MSTRQMAVNDLNGVIQKINLGYYEVMRDESRNIEICRAKSFISREKGLKSG